MHRICTILILIVGCFSGCASQPLNPSFPLTSADAKVAWCEMEHHPKPLARPVVVLGGIYDPGIAAGHVASQIKEIAGKDAPIISVGFFVTGSFESSAASVVEKVEKEFPSSDPTKTVEVDVIGYSMGGLVGRYAASGEYAAKTGKRLNIKRLFTVSSPHMGAKLAWVPTLDGRVIDMRHDSDFLARLNAEPRDYEIYPYARLGDEVVGEENSAPPGHIAWWLPKTFSLSHLSAYSDKRVLADIARRLRDEDPFTIEPAAPLPGLALAATHPSE